MNLPRQAGICLGLIMCGACQAGADEAALPSPQHKTWQEYGGGADQSKYMDLKEITKNNVNQLQIVWNYNDPQAQGIFFNPIVVDGVMYVVAKNGVIVALDATTGKEIWTSEVYQGIIKTGINYWESKDKKDRRLIICANQYLQAVDAATGQSITNFGDNGKTWLKEGLGRDPSTVGRAQNTAPGTVCGDLILLGMSPGETYFSAPGHVRAYSCVTGKMVWVFHTIPFPGEPGYETWPKDAYKYAGGVNTWGEITVDEKNGIAYFPLGAPTWDYYGADRVGDDLYDECILALDVHTGKHLWHFQTVHHGLWDYDLTSAPELVTVQHDGKQVEAVAVAGKVGFLYVFDRLTGKPLWPIEERPVPPSELPEEHASPTQPFPTAPPPFTRQNVTTNDINPYFTPEKHAEWVKRIAAAKTGLFVPLSDKYEVISMPGAVGGANRGCTAADPEHGIVYVTANEQPSVYNLLDAPPLRSLSTAKLTNVSDGAAVPVEPALGAEAIRNSTCNVCHGANRTNMVNVPDLTNVARLSFTEFQTIMKVGKGQMPAFSQLDDSVVSELFTNLGGTMPATNAVAGRGRRGGRGNQGYPDGVVGPTHNYRVAAGGYGLEFPNLLAPPWSTITAYDLNKGTIKWHVALGTDRRVKTPDGSMTGLPSGQSRKGMIITSTGIVFCTCGDGKLYAYDADDGKVIWQTTLPQETQGIPAMYEVNGHAYIAICLTGQRQQGAIQKGYVVYGLPDVR